MKNLKKKSAAVMASLCVCAAVVASGQVPYSTYGTEINLTHSSIEVVPQETDQGHVRKDISNMSSTEIADELLYYEDDELIKSMVRQSTAILTGEEEIQGRLADGFLIISTCSADQAVSGSMPNWRLVGRSDYYSYKEGDTFYSVIPPNTLTQNDVKENREMLENLYHVVWDVVEEAEGMTDREKIAYFSTWIKTNIPNQANMADSPAYVLYKGCADCGGKANLIYLFALNSGIDVNTVKGQYLGESHSWNQVKVDGEWYYLDLYSVPALHTKENMLKLGYDFTPAAPRTITTLTTTLIE